MREADQLPQSGLGTYALSYVANDVDGAAYARAVGEFSACFRRTAVTFTIPP
jgi:hypothetical protein